MDDKYCFVLTQLCLTTSAWASWVQAIGSILTILLTALLAFHAARVSYTNALKLQRANIEHDQISTMHHLSQLAVASSAIVDFIRNTLDDDREKVGDVVEGRATLDLGLLARVEREFSNFPTKGLPRKFAAIPLVFSIHLAEFIKRSEDIVRDYRKTDAMGFDRYFEENKKALDWILGTAKNIDEYLKNRNAVEAT